MDRGERREINKRKWFNKLKKVFNSKVFDWYKKHGESGSGTAIAPDDQSISPKNWKDMLKTKDGVAYKETSTIWHNPKTEKDQFSDAKALHKRDKNNKTLSDEDKEELNDYLIEQEDKKHCYCCKHFRKCRHCPYFGQIEGNTEYKSIGCHDFLYDPNFYNPN